MTIAEALDIVVARTKHERFRQLCDETHPDFNPAYVAKVLSMAGAPPPKLPPLMTRAANFASAVVSHVAAGMPTLGDDQVAARLAVCRDCPKFIAPNSCEVCGCNLSTKASWADQDCPLAKWPETPSPHHL